MHHAEEKKEKKSSLLTQLDSIYGNSDLITDEELNSLFEIDDDFLRFMLI